MLKYLARSRVAYHRLSVRRYLSDINVPFQDDLSSADPDDFGLSDFQQYQESPDVIAKKLELYGEKQVIPTRAKAFLETSSSSLQDRVTSKQPMVFVSKLSSPYLNLAIEDYIYNNMPIPEDDDTNYNRLMFYTNSPCVVIGKNQNPWKEVNIPLLNSLQIPLVRRRSGGGTVVHDQGNVNYSFMTTKGKFDRFKFANLVRDAINGYSDTKYKIEVNDRGDITTEKQPDGVSYKISGSAYKLSKGKSYHHGTMLLNSRLDILGKLLSRDEIKIGKIEALSAISSVKSKVINLELPSEKFIELVSEEFSQEYGFVEPEEREENSLEKDEFDQNELFGLTDFVEANKLGSETGFFQIDDNTELPKQILDTSKELQQWSWRFGSTQKFRHQLRNEKLGFTVTFNVGKHAILESFDLEFDDTDRLVSKDKIIESFKYLKEYIEEEKMEYTGSQVAGFITDDMISDWVGECIDGTV